MSPKLQCHISETTIGRDVYILKAGNPIRNWTFDIGLYTLCLSFAKNHICAVDIIQALHPNIGKCIHVHVYGIA